MHKTRLVTLRNLLGVVSERRFGDVSCALADVLI
jgi:hypothetical protein